MAIFGKRALRPRPNSNIDPFDKQCFMAFAICTVSVAPLRATAADKSEMVSQLLFGETVETLEFKNTWVRVRCTWDNYVGWMDFKQLYPISERELQEIGQQPAYSLELMQGASCNDHFLPLLMGASLPHFDGIRFRLGAREYIFSGRSISPTASKPSIELLLKIARRYLYAPYLWGGRSPFGVDCSGLVQCVFKMLGIALPRDAGQQVELGTPIDFIEFAQPGDLAFFENTRGKVSHVGIILPENTILHAHGMVKINQLDHFGIYDMEKEKYTHKLRVIKRLLDEDYAPPRPKLSQAVAAFAENQASLFSSPSTGASS